MLDLDEEIFRRRIEATNLRLFFNQTWPQPLAKPTAVELGVLTALAQTYGQALLNHADFAPALDCIVEDGAVVLVQRVLWGERSEDVRLAARLLVARVPFEILCGTWPEVFMAQADAELRGSGRSRLVHPMSGRATMVEPTPAPEELTVERGYTAKDFTALRAYVERIAPAVIARTYYDPHAATSGAMERHLAKMLDALVQLALAHGSTVLAGHLRASIKQHGRPKLTAVTFRMVTEAAQLAAAAPHPDHAIGAWLRPRVARWLKGEGIATLGELVAFCNRRGASWWRSTPRIGPGRACVIVSWLRRQQSALSSRRK
ncbi:phage integrase family protein [Caballeronia terrestris]|uniref:phage integrase family protein n=1 Tax=Caballeronia terrestris TaxID=1226301 RepID=UPI001F41ED97|nr:phage integrase family protein [Caballeronia terrestris]